MKRLIKNWLLKHLFDATTEKDFLVIKNGILFFNGERVSMDRYNIIATKADELRANDLLASMLRELKHNAKEKIYYKNDNEFGKALLYAVSLIENKIATLSKLHNK